jgi:hypothetical protein
LKREFKRNGSLWSLLARFGLQIASIWRSFDDPNESKRVTSVVIVSASYRTDIPAFYGGWFQHRVAHGFAQTPNPYGGRDYRVSLRREDVDGFVFWTRNAAPFKNGLNFVHERGYPFYIQFTITGYPRLLETSTIEALGAVDQIHRLVDLYGAHAVVWRYDPIVLTDLTTPQWQVHNFRRIAGALRGCVSEVVISWMTVYAKTARRLTKACADAGIEWRDPGPEEKLDLVRQLAEMASDTDMRLTVCAQPELQAGSATPARCIDPDRLSQIAGQTIVAKTKGNRPGCLCAASRDIGVYDSCPHGCVYCYAVGSADAAKQNFVRHDRAADALMVRSGAKT